MGASGLANNAVVSDTPTYRHRLRKSDVAKRFPCTACDNQQWRRPKKSRASVFRQAHVSESPLEEFSCTHCTDGFHTFNELERHRLTYYSDIKNHAYPFCSSRHASLSAVTAHLDPGGCSGGANRQCGDQRIIGATVNNSFGVAGVIVPRRSAPFGPTITYSATEMARISRGRYGCYFCPGMDFATLSQLNQHLESPKHSKRMPWMYTCQMCRIQTQTLSGLIQHAEMGGCGVRRDGRVRGTLEGLTQGMKQLGW